MKLQYRIKLLNQLGEYIVENSAPWQEAKQKALAENSWFIEPFTTLASNNIGEYFLKPGSLEEWVAIYKVPDQLPFPKLVGLVMAGNIPLVGFHDFLCIFISGHRQMIKPSSKDSALIKHLVNKLVEWEPAVKEVVDFADRLQGCDAYIATGSNNSGRYFEYYFRNHQSIIRKNRTSVAVLSGNETFDELEKLADDMLLYFGLGCRNVSKLYVPKDYDFIPLLKALDKYKWMEDNSKFKNNYDYNLSLHILNNKYYMTNGTVLFIENSSNFSPISQVHIEYYEGKEPENLMEKFPDEIQCIISHKHTPFGQAQFPSLTDYADGIDTMAFLKQLALD